MATHVLYTTYPNLGGTGSVFDAAFRQHVLDFMTLLSVTGHLTQVITNASGEVRITDSPNIDSITNPASDAVGCWAVFRFNDTLQSTVPYFFRFDMGRNNDRFYVLITIGNNVNTTTGVIGTPFVSNMFTGPSVSGGGPASYNTVYPSFVCGNPGSISIAYKPDNNTLASTNTFFIGLYRKRNSAGVQLETGLDVFTTTSSTNISAGSRVLQCRQHTIGQSNLTGGVPYNALFPTDRTDQFAAPDNTINVSRMFVPSVPTVLLPELLSVGAGRMGLGQTIDVPVYGATQKYICVASLGTSYGTALPTDSSGLLMNWF